jgi:hypothetical protein
MVAALAMAPGGNDVPSIMCLKPAHPFASRSFGRWEIVYPKIGKISHCRNDRDRRRHRRFSLPVRFSLAAAQTMSCFVEKFFLRAD